MDYLFWLFVILGIAAAVNVVSAKNPVSAAIALVVTLLNVAGIYILLDATFLGIIQILVYAGAIIVLFIFVIMMLNLNEEEIKERQASKPVRFIISLASVSSMGLLFLFFRGKVQFAELVSAQMPLGYGNVKAVGWQLFTEYLIPFEVTSVLLLVAILGAVLLAKRSLKI